MHPFAFKRVNPRHVEGKKAKRSSAGISVKIQLQAGKTCWLVGPDAEVPCRSRRERHERSSGAVASAETGFARRPLNSARELPPQPIRQRATR